MGLLLATGLTLVSASPASPAAPAWACAYVANRLPRALRLLGEDAISDEEARAALRRLSLGETVLTRASALTLARNLGASRLVMVRCRTEAGLNDLGIEARAFDVDSPAAGPAIRTARPSLELPSAVDEIAQLVAGAQDAGAANALGYPSPATLGRIGAALAGETVTERARSLTQALREDPASIELRLMTTEALFAARDFDAATQAGLGARVRPADQELGRMLRFLGGAAQLEGGRYAEAFDTFEALRKERETSSVLNNLGVARFRMRYKDASSLFEKAAALQDPRPRDIAFNQSLALIFEGRAEAAVRLLDEALASDPSDTRTRLLKVWSLRVLGRNTERDEEWQRLMALAPSFSSLALPDLARRLERIFVAERQPQRATKGGLHSTKSGLLPASGRTQGKADPDRLDRIDAQAAPP